MKSIFPSAAFALLLAAQLSAADRLFLFQDDSATVFETPGLSRIGTARVGSGAFAAFRVANGTYVVAVDRVTVLGDDLQAAGEIALGARATAAALDPLTSQLLVAASGRLYRIDTASNRIASVLTTAVEPSSIVIPRDARLAYLLTTGSRQAIVVDLEADRVLPGAANLAAIPGSIAGTSIGAGNELFSASPVTGGIAGLRKSSVGPAALLAASESGARLLRSNGALLLASANGEPATPLLDPATGGSLAGSVVHAALSPNGETAYLALDDGRLLGLHARSESAPATAFLASAPTAMALTSNPAQNIFTLAKVSGDQQSVLEGSNFDIVVTGGVIGGVPLAVESSSPAAQCDNVPPLSGNTTITCTANAVSAVTTVMLTVSTTGADPVVFTIYVVPAGLPDGLFIISGDNQTVGASDAFSLVVEARQNGLPLAGTPIAAVEGSSLLTCPAGSVATDSVGRASIDCTVSDFVPTSETATVTVSSNALASNVQFTVNIVGEAGPNDALVKVTSDPVTVFEGLGFNLTVQANLSGVPQTNVPLTITGGGAAVLCPTSAVTGANGQATIACGANLVNVDSTELITISDGSNAVSFSVTVVNGTVTNGFQKISGNNQVVPQNTQFPKPLVVRSVTGGQPDANVLLGVEVSNSAAVCSVSTLTDDNGLATISCTAQAVASTTQVQIQVTDASERTLAQAFTATITPSQSGSEAEAISVLSGGNLSARVGDTLQAAIQVRTQKNDGTVVSGANVFARGPQGVTIVPPVAQSDANGLASFDVTFGCAPASGQIGLGLTSTSTEAAAFYTLARGPLSQLRKLQGDGQTGEPGVRLPQALLIETADQCGTVVPNAPIAWAVVPPEAATLEAVVSISNAQGRASVLVRPSARGGAYEVRVVSLDNPELQASFSLTTQNTPASLEIVSGNLQTVPAGAQAPSPLVVEVKSAAGQPVQGIAVAFQLISGSGSLGAASATTNAQGRASTTFTAGLAHGTSTVRATAAGKNVDFTLTVGGGAPQLQVPGFVNGASFLPGFVAGSTGTIFGVNISGDVEGVAAAPYDPVSGFPTLFHGVRVTVGGIVAPILSIANVNGLEQINIQVPFGLAQGVVTVVVENDAVQGSISGIPVFNVQPGVFEYYIGEQRYAAALHADYSLVTPENPARHGEVILLFLTGLGAISPPVATNEAGPVSPLSMPVSNPSVQIELAEQAVFGSFYAPQLLTVYQINFRVSPTVTPGMRSLTVMSDGVSSQTVTLPVAPALE